MLEGLKVALECRFTEAMRDLSCDAAWTTILDLEQTKAQSGK